VAGVVVRRGMLMGDRRDRRKISCGGCGERVAKEKVRDAYRTAREEGLMRFRDHPVPDSTLTHLCPDCYRDWDVGTDGVPHL